MRGSASQPSRASLGLRPTKVGGPRRRDDRRRRRRRSRRGSQRRTRITVLRQRLARTKAGFGGSNTKAARNRPHLRRDAGRREEAHGPRDPALSRVGRSSRTRVGGINLFGAVACTAPGVRPATPSNGPVRVGPRMRASAHAGPGPIAGPRGASESTSEGGDSAFARLGRSRRGGGPVAGACAVGDAPSLTPGSMPVALDPGDAARARPEVRRRAVSAHGAEKLRPSLTPDDATRRPNPHRTALRTRNQHKRRSPVVQCGARVPDAQSDWSRAEEARQGNSGNAT